MSIRPSIAMILALASCSGPVGPEALLDRNPWPPFDASRTPWPSDTLRSSGRYAISELGLSANPDSVARLAAAVSEMDGAPLGSSIFFPLSGPYTGPLAPSVTLEVVDLTDFDPSYGAVDHFPLFYRDETREVIGRAPRGHVFAEGHVYAAYVPSGLDLHPAPAMRDAFSGSGPFASEYAPLARYLREKQLPAPLAATVFTTGHPTGDLDAMRTQLYDTPPPKAALTRYFGPADLDTLLGTPTTTRSGFGDPKGVVHDAIAHVLHGTITTPHYLHATPGRLGTFQHGDAGPKQLSTDTLPFTLILPKANSYAKIPVVFFQHGLNNDRHAAFAVANDFARAGYATLASDTLFHGSRLPGNPDHVNNTTGAPTPDGIGDPSAAGAMIHIFDLNGDKSQNIASLDPRIIRDNLSQALLDLLQAIRLAVSGDLSALAAADPALASLTLDATHLVYTGESFGSILGASVLSASPDLKAAVLSVGGGGFIQPVMVSSPAFALLMQPLFAGAFDQLVSVTDPVALPPEAQRSLVLLQGCIEPGDPETWVPRIAREGKHLLLLQAHDDEVLPNQGGDTLAIAAGARSIALHQLSTWTTPPVQPATLGTADAPYKGASSTIAIVQLEPATHGMITNFSGERAYAPPFPPFQKLPTPKPVDDPIEVTHDLCIGFFDSFRLGLPEVRDVKR